MVVCVCLNLDSFIYLEMLIVLGVGIGFLLLYVSVVVCVNVLLLCFVCVLFDYVISGELINFVMLFVWFVFKCVWLLIDMLIELIC